MPKGTVCPKFPGRVLIVITHTSITVQSQEMEHRKSKRVAYRIGIPDFLSFGFQNPKD
jgi:hypothetical protein